MKNLKLTNLEKMQEKEMAQVRGGWLYLHLFKKQNGHRCSCAQWCSPDDTRQSSGGQVYQGHYK